MFYHNPLDGGFVDLYNRNINIRKSMSYVIKDEHGDVMRIVGRKEEAQSLLLTRPEWTLKYLKPVKPEPFKFEEAPF
jgi:hypothetical protein